MKRRVNLLDSAEAGSEKVTPARKKTRSFLPEGTHGLLAKEAELRSRGNISEIDPELIDVGGPQDRFEGKHRSEADTELMESIRVSGQLLPCLVRPHPEHNGRYQSVFGNRRIAACKSLGIPVKAMISPLSDADLAITKGVENNLRLNPTFIERVRFAAHLDELGYRRGQIGEALGVSSKGVMSAIMKIASSLPAELVDLIGAAPSVGRPRWERLAEVLNDRLSSGELMARLPADLPAGSDERFQLIMAIAERGQSAAEPDQKPTSSSVFSTENLEATLKVRGKTLALSVKTSDDPRFLHWMKDHMHDVMTELHDRFQEESGEKSKANEQ